jgi:hypothetical protein
MRLLQMHHLARLSCGLPTPVEPDLWIALTATESFFLFRPTRLGFFTVRAEREAKKCIVRLDSVRSIGVGTPYRASGSGRSWKRTTFGKVPLPVSRWNIVLVAYVDHSDFPFQPPLGLSTRPSIHLVK